MILKFLKQRKKAGTRKNRKPDRRRFGGSLMRHKRIGRKLGVKSKHRKSMFRNMATELLKHNRIKTSDPRAKEIRRVVEKLITLAKKGTLDARRKAEGYVRDKEVVKKLFTELAERFKDRPGGYTRIVKLGFRRGDNAPLSLIELIEESYKPKKKPAKTTSRKKQTETADKASAKSSKKESAEDLGLVEADSNAEAVDFESAPEDTDKGEASDNKLDAKKSEAEDIEEGATKDQETEVTKPSQPEDVEDSGVKTKSDLSESEESDNEETEKKD